MAESKRITRGIQLNQQFSREFSSFNLCITQEIADNVGSAAIMAEERQSKSWQHDQELDARLISDSETPLRPKQTSHGSE
ncbi:hypothetical protein H5410_051596 [Solanum commersonii]|uniref:Uncharacterized protein n=1 Tax=Solanum commersonii TaxID=4109 RepID=A0A9J5WYL1_SOLCO|nr:hypothetical protein H5410_051596 [Solanum commersonii]